MRTALAKVGLWMPLARWEGEPGGGADAAAEIEALGFEAVWLGNGARLFQQVAGLLAATGRLTVATGTAHLATHSAASVAAEHEHLTAAYGERFVLSVGGAWARSEARPGPSGYEQMTTFLDALDAGRPAVPAARRLLAALGPKMLELSARRAGGAHPYTVPVEHTRLARGILGPAPRLVPEVKVVLEQHPDRARAIARRTLSFYLDKGNYSANLARLGFDRRELAHGGSDRVVDALVAWGSPEAIRGRIDEHLGAGADQVALQLLTDESRPGLPRDGYRRLADTLRT